MKEISEICENVITQNFHHQVSSTLVRHKYKNFTDLFNENDEKQPTDKKSTHKVTKSSLLANDMKSCNLAWLCCQF
ncbi:CLUMA_CG011726, isoform A [Clunio marinus]|uniref:CLUMA_CG011726, isoform A n=1 Tax=Clunio marinus TaxID=568069 RepID=A0A1J1IDL0_9DIPT|nr:CLUMA_CG011726, isoform A [Clunio marinus]